MRWVVCLRAWRLARGEHLLDLVDKLACLIVTSIFAC